MPLPGWLSFRAARRRHAIPLLAVIPIVSMLFSAGCDRAVVPQTHAATVIPGANDPTEVPSHRQVRATGTVQAIHSYTVQTPQIAGQGGRLTLTALAPNGANVAAGDILAEFDRTQQLDAAIQAKTKFDD